MSETDKGFIFWAKSNLLKPRTTSHFRDFLLSWPEHGDAAL